MNLISLERLKKALESFYDRISGIFATKSEMTTELNKKSDTGHSHNNATVTASGYMSKDDKAKLDGIANSANNYTHPSSHAASMITQDSTHRFVTDTEKSTWNAKASTSVATTSANGLMSSSDKTKLNGIAEGAQVNADITKAEIEAKLTGAISTHTHSYLPLSGGTLTGNIQPNTAVTRSCGSAAQPWCNVFNRYYNIYGEANKTYGNLYAATIGTTSATGETRLSLGNSTASGTASNAYGRIFMYGTNTGYTEIKPGHNSTGTVSITLPSSAGTLARTADNVASATKLQTARQINGTNFDGTGNITTANWGTARNITLGRATKSVNGSGNYTWNLDEIMGRVALTGTKDTSIDKYTKFASIDVSGGTYRCCSGVISVIPQESATVYGELYFYFRSNATIADVTINLVWNSLTNLNYVKSVVAVKTADGKYDLYFKGTNSWDTLTLTFINVFGTNLLTLYSNQSYVNSVTSAKTSVFVNPASHIAQEDLSDVTVSLNSYTLANNKSRIRYYFCPTDGGGANITGRPDDNNKTAFNLKVECIRWANENDYITKQTYTQGGTKQIYVRYCANGTWSAWEKVYTSGQKPTPADIGAAASSHNHGLLHDSLGVTIANTTTDSGWSMINSNYNGYILKSIRSQASAPAWLQNNYSAGIVFGGSDTHGIMSMAHGSPSVRFAGGNGTKPVWYFTLTGTSAKSYNLDSYLPLSGGTLTGDVILTDGKSIRLSTTDTHPRLGYQPDTQDVYISNAENNWFRLKADKTITYGGSRVYSEVDKPTASELGVLALSGGTMTGDVKLTNNVAIMGTIKTATTKTDGTAVAAGTQVDLLHLNSSDNLHIGAGIYDTNISTGGTYVSGGASATIRTVNGPVIIKPKNVNVANFTDTQIDFSKLTYAKDGIKSGANIVSDTALTDSLGTTAIPWLSAYSKQFNVYGAANKSYGYINAYTVGTTSTVGECRLVLGNNTASGTANNAKGQIFMYGTNTGGTYLTSANTSTTSYTVTLPAKTGTVALTDHTHNYAGSSSAGGNATKSEKLNVKRVTGSSNSANYAPGANTLEVKEYGNDCTNMPSAHYYHIYTGQGQDDKYQTQLAVGMTTEALCFRNRNSGTWGSWKKVALDGHTHSYLPLSGGTLTGNLTMTDGKKIQLSTNSSHTKAAIGVDSGTGDVYISNTNSNWFRIKPDKTLTMGGAYIPTAGSYFNQFWVGTQAQYDAISSKSNTTIYMITN